MQSSTCRMQTVLKNYLFLFILSFRLLSHLFFFHSFYVLLHIPFLPLKSFQIFISEKKYRNAMFWNIQICYVYILNISTYFFWHKRTKTMIGKKYTKTNTKYRNKTMWSTNDDETKIRHSELFGCFIMRRHTLLGIIMHI